MKTCLFTAFMMMSLGMTVLAQDGAQPVDGSAPSAEAPPETSEQPAEPAAENMVPEEDGPAIPVAFDLSRYESTWDKNPFNLKTAPTAQPTVDWTQDWALAGMYSYKGKIQISMRNKQTNEIKRITNTPKEGDEFRFVEANFHRSKKEASAKIAKGTQEGVLKYDENAAPVTVNNTIRQTSGANGQQGAPGGMNQTLPGRPGGQPNITKPVSPTANGRVFNSPTLPGGMAQPGGMIQGGAVGNFNNGVPTGGAVVQPGVMNPTLPMGTNGATPPTISRRRQLIPAPVVSPQSNP